MRVIRRGELGASAERAACIARTSFLLVMAALPVLAALIWALLVWLSNPSSGWADTPGPGLGNLTYSSDEAFQPVGILNSPDGHGNVAMVNGYLMVIYSQDGGGTSGDGGIEFWDVSDPRNPTLFARHDNVDTHGLREAHGFAFSSSYPGDYMVAQAVEGIQFWDLSDPLNISLLSYLDLPGISGGDYTGAWWVFWQAPYVYVAGTGSGLYVIDATNPGNPSLLNRVPTSNLGGLVPGQVFAVGNLLVLMEHSGSGYTTMDISDPANPKLVQKFDGKAGYSHLFSAGKILTSGASPDQAVMYVHDVSPEGRISFAGQAGSGLAKGGYGSYQDGFFLSGFSRSFAKFDTADLTQEGSGTSGLPGRDEDFAQVLGNLVFVGDDHGVGSGLMVHQTTPDQSGPEVHWVNPPENALGVPLTTRVGLSLSDNVDIESVNASTVVVRPREGRPLPGKYSAQMGLVNFWPEAPLQPNTTYEIVVSGVRDYAGNPGGTFTSEFRTGGPALISNVQSGSGNNYESESFAAGQTAYVDRDYTFSTQFPPQFEGQDYIRTANGDKRSTSSDFLTFNLSAAASVYVLYDSRATQVPSWLGDGTWTLTGDRVGTTDVERVVYRKDFPEGSVTLGGNAAAPAEGASSMYNVVAVGRASNPPPTCSIAASEPAEVNAPVHFTASVDSGAESDSYSWDFGDGNVREGSAAATHEFSSPGRYSVILSVESPSGSATCSMVQIIHNPLSPLSPSASSAIIHNGAHAISVNPDNDTITAIDDQNLTKSWEIPVGRNPRTLAEATDGGLWVVNQGDATISVLEPDDGSLRQTIALPDASRPYGISFAPDGSAAYVTLQGSGRLLKLDSSGNVLGDVYLGPKPRGIAISGDSRRILVTRFVSPEDHGVVWEVDPATFEVLRTFNLAFDPGPDTESSGRGAPNYISSIRITPDDKRAFVPSKKDNVARGMFRDGQPLTFESRVRTIVSQISLVGNEEDLEARLDLNDRDMAQSVIFTPLGDIFLVATQGSNRVEAYDAHTLGLLGGMDTGLAPQGMAFNPGASKLFVQNFMSRSVSVFDTQDLVNAHNNSVSLIAEIPTAESEALSPQILAGKQIFYNAADPRIGRDGYTSCASCHVDGGSDGRVWDFTQRGEGLRNTISLLGRSGTGHGNLHWTANFDEIQDFENDIRTAFGGTGFMSDSDFDVTGDPLGHPKKARSAELDALAAYVGSLDRTPDSPYRKASGALTDDGRAGKQIFLARNCQSCHSGPEFTDGRRHDVGTVQPASGLGMGEPLDGIGLETPTLKGIWDTPPYLHHGQAATLQEVLSNPDHGDTEGLTSSELDQLISYLLQLDENESAGLISNIAVISGTTYEVGTLESGGQVYVDRTYTFTDVPVAYAGQEFIRTANGDKWEAGPDYLSFFINQSARVYILYDVRATAPPAWLDDGSWSLSGDVVGTSDVDRRVYEKAFPAGLVQLGGNAASPMAGARSNFNVVAIPLSDRDTGPPSVSIDFPRDGTVLKSATRGVTGSATDDSRLSQVEVKVNSRSFQPAEGLEMWEYGMALDRGANTITARATDNAGNTSFDSVTVTYDPPEVITNIRVGNGNSYHKDTLEVGKLVYTDRPYVFTSMPAAYVGQEFIRTANDDKWAAGSDFLQFDLGVPSRVLLALDRRFTTLPAFVDDTWTRLPDVVGTSDVDRIIYEKRFSAGPVVLGGNSQPPAAGAKSNYNVFALPVDQ